MPLHRTVLKAQNFGAVLCVGNEPKAVMQACLQINALGDCSSSNMKNERN